jgi:beta-galactosidase/beta-glucuronidase
VRKVAIVGSASGNGKTTLGKRVARRLDVPFVELDALVHGPNWLETPDDELRARVQPVIDSADWVIDGAYRRKLGDLVLEHADTVVWLDLPVRVWFPRLLRRTVRRLRTREKLWNDNTESLRGAFWGRESLFGVALRLHFEHRRRYPIELAPYEVVHLRSAREVERWLSTITKQQTVTSSRATGTEGSVAK